MDSMMWIHADGTLREIRQLDLIIAADMQVDISPSAKTIDNTWSLTIPENVWEEAPIRKGHFIYSPGTEWGGPVTLVRHNTSKRQIILQGPTWRGILHQRFIYPPSGQAYLNLEEVDANAAITQAAGNLGSLFSVSSDSAGKNVSGSFRYQSVAAGLERMFREYQLRLGITFDSSIPAAVLSAQTAQNLSNIVEISQDYGINFTSEAGNTEEANHCLALGSGELENRTVLSVYRVGNVYYTEQPPHITNDNLRTVKLDYPNAEDESDLLSAALERLQEHASQTSIKVDEVTMDQSFDLGDIIDVRDRTTGMAGKAEAVQKILSINHGRTSIALQLATVIGAGSNVDLHTWADLYTVTWSEAAEHTWGDFIQ